MIHRFLLVALFVLCLGVVSAQDEDGFDWTLVAVQPAEDITESTPRHARVSPDASMLVFDNDQRICIHTFATAETTCAAFPQATPGGAEVDLDSHLAYHWSPDSRYVAFTEDALRNVVDSDIWIYDVVESKFTALTNDDFGGVLFRFDERAEITVDLLPTWHPITGDLYFIRYTVREDDITTALYRIPQTGGTMLGGVMDAGERQLNVDELEQITTFQTEYPYIFFNLPTDYSFGGALAISPNGETMALLSRGQRPQDSAVLLVDLASGDVTTMASYDDLIASEFFPTWAEDLRGYLPGSVTWTADSQILVNITDRQFFAGLFNVIVTVDPVDGAVTTVLDHTAAPSAEEYISSADYEHPRIAIMSPDDRHLLYFNAVEFIPQINLSVIPAAGGDPQVLHEFDVAEFDQIPMYFASVGANDTVMRVAMHGYIFTFDRVD